MEQVAEKNEVIFIIYICLFFKNQTVDEKFRKILITSNLLNEPNILK